MFSDMPTELAVTSVILALTLTAMLVYHVWDDRREDKLLLDRAKRNLDDELD
jgi:hypothetical protein